MQVYVVINDIQYPFHDAAVLDGLVVPFIKELKPYGVILNGDIVDNYQLSVFDKNPLTKEGLKTEIELVGRLMRELSKVTKGPKVWIGGNHEDRLRRYIWANASALVETGLVDFDRVFKVAEYGFTYKPYGDKYYLGKLMATHGSIVRQASGITAKAHFEKYGTSVIIGHTHRLGAYYRTNVKGPHVAYENGHLCDVDKVEYVQDPDWQQGFAVVQVFEDGVFNVEQIPIFEQGGKKIFIYGGEKYCTVQRKAA